MTAFEQRNHELDLVYDALSSRIITDRNIELLNDARKVLDEIKGQAWRKSGDNAVVFNHGRLAQAAHSASYAIFEALLVASDLQQISTEQLHHHRARNLSAPHVFACDPDESAGAA